MPTAVAKPWPSGPVVVSIAGCSPNSGWPAAGESELAETLDLLDPHALVAGQVEQRVEQHRAMAGRQHEAVAVRPARVGGIEFVKAAPTVRWPRPPCPSACRDGRILPPPPRRWRAPGSHSPFARPGWAAAPECPPDRRVLGFRSWPCQNLPCTLLAGRRYRGTSGPGQPPWTPTGPPLDLSPSGQFTSMQAVTRTPGLPAPAPPRTTPVRPLRPRRARCSRPRCATGRPCTA